MSKFDSPVAEFLHTLSLDGGCDEEMGSVQFQGWAGLIKFDEHVAEMVNALLPESQQNGRCCWFADDEDPDPDTIITGHWGAILTEDTDGSVGCMLLPGSTEADEEWDRQRELLSEDTETSDVPL